MSDWEDRLVADAMRRAEDVFAEQADLGELLWAKENGSRGFASQVGSDAVVTVLTPEGLRLRYVIEGVELAALR